jgi:hypothetical protein
MVSSTPAGSGLPIGLMPGALPSDQASRQTLKTTAMRLPLGQVQSVYPVVSDVYGKPLLPQTSRHEVRDTPVIFDEENAHLVMVVPAGRRRQERSLQDSWRAGEISTPHLTIAQVAIRRTGSLKADSILSP